MRLVVLSLGLMLTGAGCGSHKMDFAEKFSQIPPVNYRHIDLPDLPYGRIAVAIGNTRNYQSSRSEKFREFSDASYQINKALIEYAADRFELTEDEKKQALAGLQEDQYAVALDYFEDLQQLLSTPEYMPKDSIVLSFPTYSAVKAMGRVLASRVCTIAGVLISAVTSNTAGSVTAAIVQQPCETLLAEALMPILQELQNKALLQDHMNVRLTIQEHVREMILELATVQDSFKTSYYVNPKRNIRFLPDSEAHLEMKVTGKVKAGYDLKKAFTVEIDERSASVVVSLPRAEILSIDLIPEVENIQHGWAISIDKHEINQGIRVLREMIEDKAIVSGILTNAETKGVRAVTDVLGPMLDNPFVGYKLYVRIGDGSLVEAKSAQ